MKKFLKISFKIVILLLFVAIVGGAIFVATFDINSFKQKIVAEVNKATGGELIINGDMQLHLSLSPYFEINNVAFRNPEFKTTQDLFRVKKASVVISVVPLLYKTISIRDLVLEDPSVYLTKNAQGQANWDFVKIMAAKTADVQNIAPAIPAVDTTASAANDYILDLGKITGKNINLVYEDELTKQMYHLHVKNLEASPKNDKLEIAVHANYNNVPITLQATTSDIIDIINIGSVEMDVAALVIDSRFGLSGQTDLDFKKFDFKVKGEAPEISRITNAFGLPMDKMGALKLDGRVYGSMDEFKFALNNLSLAGNGVTGDVAVKMLPTLDVQFKLHSPMIDTLVWKSDKVSLDEMHTTDMVASSSKNEKLFSSTPISFDFLDAGEIKGALSIDKLVWGEKEKPISTILTSGIDMNSSRLLFGINSRTGNGTGAVNVALNRVSSDVARLAMNSTINIPSASEFVPKANIVSGIPITLTLKGESIGSSVADLMANLDGNIYMVAKEGSIHKDGIAWLGGDILTQTLYSVMPQLTKNETVDFICGAANIDIKNGEVNLDKSFAVQTEKFNLISDGEVDLDSEKLDIQFGVDSLQGAHVSVSDILSGLLEVKGTLAHPEVGMGAKQVVGAAVRTGLAVLTSGISLAGEKAADIAVADENPCQTAWNKGNEVSVTSDDVNNVVQKGVEKGTKVLKDAYQELKGLFK